MPRWPVIWQKCVSLVYFMMYEIGDFINHLMFEGIVNIRHKGVPGFNFFVLDDDEWITLMFPY